MSDARISPIIFSMRLYDKQKGEKLEFYRDWAWLREDNDYISKHGRLNVELFRFYCTIIDSYLLSHSHISAYRRRRSTNTGGDWSSVNLIKLRSSYCSTSRLLTIINERKCTQFNRLYNLRSSGDPARQFRSTARPRGCFLTCYPGRTAPGCLTV